MSRDQRPRRVTMIDSGPLDTDLKQRAADQVEGNVTDQPGAPAAAPKSRALLWGMVFLLACVAGAVGISLLPQAGLS